MGQGHEEAREHVEVKLGIIRKRVGDVWEVSLGLYSGYCAYWRSEQGIRVVVSELFSLLSTARLTQLSVNLDAYSVALVACLSGFRLPSTLKQLTLSNDTQPNLDFLRPCLLNLESLTLRATCSRVGSDFISLEPLLGGSSLPKLHHLEVDRASQLSSLRNCALPALEDLSVVTLYRSELQEFLVDFLLSLSPLNHSAYHTTRSSRAAPILRHLSLRVAYNPNVRPSPSMLYEGLLLRPSIITSGVLAHLQTLTLVHELFSSNRVQDAALDELLHSYRELCEFRWDVLLDSMYHRGRVNIGPDVLRKAFCLDGGRNGMREIAVRAMLWRGMPLMSSWVRRFVSVACGIPGEQSWTVVDETR